MPVITNAESNITLKIDLVHSDSLDMDSSRPDFMNWIPFNLIMNVNGEILTYSSDVLPAFSVVELRYLVKRLNEAINVKRNHELIVESLKFVSSENLFELTLHETQEKNLIEFELWFNMGSLTNGEVYGFSKGFRFVSCLKSLVSFTRELENQFGMFCE